MNAAGHRLGRITHLDPVGLCFGRLFSKPQFRLSPDDALDTQAVHVSLNIFDNPLDGVHSNFLVNGGRDQLGCGGQSELKNSTTSSVSLLFDPAAKFAPCSHLRALALLEDDHSSEPGQCQYVGYRCSSYERFLAGKCGHCDAVNSQCRLMGLAPIRVQLKKTNIADAPVPLSLLMHSPLTQMPYKADYSHHLANLPHGSLDLYSSGSLPIGGTLRDTNENAPDDSRPASASQANASTHVGPHPKAPQTLSPKQQHFNQQSDAMQAQASSKLDTSCSTKTPGSSMSLGNMFGAPAYIVGQLSGNELRRRSDRSLSIEQGARIANVLGKLRADTRSALAESLSNLGGGLRAHLSASQDGPEYSYSSEEEQSAGEEQEENSGAATTTAALPPPTTTLGSAGSLASHAGTAMWTDEPRKTPTIPSTNRTKHHEPADQASHRIHLDALDQIPIGSQPIPAGSLNMPLYFLGSGAVSPFCVNYYQMRILIAESRLLRVLQSQGLASNRLAPQLSQHNGGLVSAAATMQQRAQTASGRDMLHLTVKLTDTFGHFFKGFSILEHSRMLARVPNDLAPQQPPMPMAFMAPSLSEPLIEITMLLNTTRQEPIKVGESILSYYFHPIVLADRIEVNYMSNISPE